MDDNPFGSALKRGWADSLFGDYRFFPVMGSEEGIKYLSSNGYIRGIMKRAVNRIDPLSIIKTLTGYNLLNAGNEAPRQKPFLAEVWEEWERHKNEHETITEKAQKKYKYHANKALAFSSLSAKFSLIQKPETSDYLAPLYDEKGGLKAVDGAVISIHGSLSRNSDSSLVNADVGWILRDQPYFSSDSSGGTVLLKIAPAILDNIEDGLPFWKGVGWYPYVRITGRFNHSYLSLGIPSIEVYWVEYRAPMDLNMRVNRQKISDAYSEPVRGRFSQPHDHVNKSSVFDLRVFLDILRIMAKNTPSNLDNADEELRELIDNAEQRIQQATKAD
jgi:hypothetical protein